MKSVDELREALTALPNHEDYIQNPHFCPFCEHPVIEATRFDCEGRVAWQWVRCDKCGAEWHDIFELVAIEKVEIP